MAGPESRTIDHHLFKVNRGLNMWDNYEFGVPGKYYEMREDFDRYVAADWTVSDTGANTQALATAAPTVGGVLLITLANADNNLSSLQKVGHSVVPTAGTTIWFEAMLQMSEATQSDFLVGLVITDTTPLANTDGIYFRKDDGDTQIDFETNASSTASTETNISTFAAATYVKLGFRVTGTTLVEYWVNDVSQGSFTTNIPAVPLRPTLHFQDGDAAGAVGAITASVDYVYVIQSRPHY